MVEFSVVEMEPQVATVMRGKVPMDELADFFGRAFGAVMAAVEQSEHSVVGPPFGYYPSVPGDVVELEAGFPTSGPVDGDEVNELELPGGPAAVGVHVGSYDSLGTTYAELEQWLEAEGHERREGMWECYLTDPSADPSTWRTQIVWPIVG